MTFAFPCALRSFNESKDSNKILSVIFDTQALVKPANGNLSALKETYNDLYATYSKAKSIAYSEYEKAELSRLSGVLERYTPNDLLPVLRLFGVREYAEQNRTAKWAKATATAFDERAWEEKSIKRA